MHYAACSTAFFGISGFDRRREVDRALMLLLAHSWVAAAVIEQQSDSFRSTANVLFLKGATSSEKKDQHSGSRQGCIYEYWPMVARSYIAVFKTLLTTVLNGVRSLRRIQSLNRRNCRSHIPSGIPW
jgi:hypothetical protein